MRQVQSIIATVKNELVIIDGYVSVTVLDLVSGKPEAVPVRILTNGVTDSVIAAAKTFNAQYGGLSIRISPNFHDRFIIVDDSDFFHLGASIKDAGKRTFMFSRIEDRAVIEALRAKLTAEWEAAAAISV